MAGLLRAPLLLERPAAASRRSARLLLEKRKQDLPMA